MNALEVGKKLVSLCRNQKNVEAIEALYHPDIVSVEAVAMPNMPQEMRGMKAVIEKNKWWIENHEVHSGAANGPYPHGDRFAVHFAFDITQKATGERMKIDEIGLYTVRDGKIIKEEFFYAM